MFIVRCRDVDVVSHGESIDETLADLEEALSLYFEGEELHLVTVLDELGDDGGGDAARGA